MMPEEKVLCIKRAHLPPQWTEEKSIVRLDSQKFYGICAQAGYHWMDRGGVEQDPSFKQIIPYILVQTTAGDQTAVYRRKGSEQRLHDLWSAGIGGHVNQKDITKRADGFADIVKTGMMRELDEEFLKRPENLAPVFWGTINEEKTDVGSVHLGAVFKIAAENMSGFVPGSELVDFKWADTVSLSALNMELWSGLALELLSR
ncbi:MAG: phosphoesterase [Thermodesulfobacteriota bacterium]|nr:phosphoesterase [Thermodesulfobacteriota bacterium]